MKKIFYWIGSIVGLIISLAILAVVLLFALLTVTEYNPADVERVTLKGGGTSPGDLPVLSEGKPLTLLSWNIGYASLDKHQDFFMDGGKGVMPENDTYVKTNLAGILNLIQSRAFNVIMLQEVDRDSRRSYHIDETEPLSEGFGGTMAYAYNFLCKFVPFPFPRFMGKVSSGLLTLNSYRVSRAERISLPVPFAWPVRMANLKRCLLAERMPVAGNGKKTGGELILINLHMEAYDDSGGREAQTQILMEFMEAEYAKGNYCIAGGDFNQNFPGAGERYPLKEDSLWAAGSLSPGLIPKNWQFAFDSRTPSCRLLNKPYSGLSEDTQYYIIDGFILSPNIELLSVNTINMDFEFSDHNPVELTVRLKP
jgi:endonuclease/exonuclease/phosphatase family metal-dependent hydrolase